MPIYTAFATLGDRDRAEALGEALDALDPAPSGTGVMEIEDGSGRYEVAGYFEAPPDEIGLALLSLAHGATEFVVSEVPETDWVAHVRRELAPVEAGRFFLYGSHDADRLPPGRVGLLIEAAMAFGTGHHGTTRGCLIAFDRLLGEGHAPTKVADIGCGTAVLAMAAAKVLPAGATVIASDIDPLAVEVSEANVAANGLSGRVLCREAEGFDHPDLRAAAPFGLVFANILKGPLLSLAPAMRDSILPNGKAILSGILTTQSDDVVNGYSDCGFIVSNRDILGEWTTLTLTRNPG